MTLNSGTDFEVSDRILEKFKVGKKDRDRISAVAKYDLSDISADLSDELIRTGRAYSCEQAYPLMANFGKADARLSQRLELEFKRFCILTLIKPGVPHAPPGAVDMYWHFLILHTREYITFCESTWGDFMGEPRLRDHFPSKDATRKGMLEAYKATRNLYVEVFSEPRNFEMDGIARDDGEVLPVSDRPIWVPASDTSGDSYSGVVDPS